MIIFNNLWITMKKRKISTYQLREKTGIDSKTIRRLKANENIETKTLNKLCTALNCKLEDIAEYVQIKNSRRNCQAPYREELVRIHAGKKLRTFPIHHRRLVPQPSNTYDTDPG